MDIKKIKKIIDLLKESEMTEIEVHEGENSVRISKASQYLRSVEPNFISQAAPNAPLSSPSSSQSVQSTEPASDDLSNLHVVKSPVVGRFYQSTSPDKPPLAKVGDHVKEGQALCIVEAMKMMNQIESEVAGVIVKIALENDSPVEFGQHLFHIKPD